jgi:hypothetical protein
MTLHCLYDHLHHTRRPRHGNTATTGIEDAGSRASVAGKLADQTALESTPKKGPRRIWSIHPWLAACLVSNGNGSIAQESGGVADAAMAWGETMALRSRGDWPAAPGRRRQRRMAARRQRLAVQRPTVSRAATRFEPINFLARGSLCVLVHPCCVLEHPSGSVPLDPLPLQPMSTPACLSAPDRHQGTKRTTTPLLRHQQDESTAMPGALRH